MDENQLTQTEKRGGRPRRERVEVWLTGEEKAAVVSAADAVGMTASAYLRALAQNTPVRSRVDADAVADLVRVGGDLGRVAGLLKLWLAEKRGQGAHPLVVEAMMRDFRELQREVRVVAAQIVTGK